MADQPLPPETTAYVAAVTRLLGKERAELAPFRIKGAFPWRKAPPFVERTDVR